MSIPESISLPSYPRFIPTPDDSTMELFITCTNPLALIWVRQTVPAQLYIVEGPMDEKLLRDCAVWYKAYVTQHMDKN